MTATNMCSNFSGFGCSPPLDYIKHNLTEQFELEENINNFWHNKRLIGIFFRTILIKLEHGIIVKKSIIVIGLITDLRLS